MNFTVLVVLFKRHFVSVLQAKLYVNKTGSNNEKGKKKPANFLFCFVAQTHKLLQQSAFLVGAIH